MHTSTAVKDPTGDGRLNFTLPDIIYRPLAPRDVFVHVLSTIRDRPRCIWVPFVLQAPSYIVAVLTVSLLLPGLNDKAEIDLEADAPSIGEVWSQINVYIRDHTVPLVITLIIGVLWSLTLLLAHLASIHASACALLHLDVSYKRSIGAAARALPKYIMSSIAPTLLVLVGLLLFVVPGLIAMLLFFVFLAHTVVLERGTPCCGAMMRSYRLFCVDKCNVLLYVLVSATFGAFMWGVGTSLFDRLGAVAYLIDDLVKALFVNATHVLMTASFLQCVFLEAPDSFDAVAFMANLGSRWSSSSTTGTGRSANAHRNGV